MTDVKDARATEGDTQWIQSTLRAVVSLCGERTYDDFAMSDIAARAGVDEELIRSRWPKKSLLVAQAVLGRVAPDMVFPRTGDIAVDLPAQLSAVVRLFGDPSIGPHLVALATEARSDPQLAGFFLQKVFGPNRAAARARFELAQEQGQLRTDLDLDTAVDMVFGPIWFRLLLGTGPLDAGLGESIAEHALAGLTPR